LIRRAAPIGALRLSKRRSAAHDADLAQRVGNRVDGLLHLVGADRADAAIRKLSISSSLRGICAVIALKSASHEPRSHSIERLVRKLVVNGPGVSKTASRSTRISSA
jgi:hypothetical protein